MYAIVKCGGKQLKVQQGDIVKVERLAEEAGSKVELTEVLLVAEGENVTVGTPMVEGAKVTATVLEQKRDKKVIVFKKKRRQGYKLKKGHRQYVTVLKVESVEAKGAKAPAKKTTAKKAPAKKAEAKEA